jgi:hypothetical protein
VKLIALAAAGLAGVLLTAAPALADERVVAKLQTPVRGSVKIIAGEAVFVCAEDTCEAGAPMSQTFALATCKAIAARFGTVMAFTGRLAFEPERLAKCNAGASPRATAAEGVMVR